MIKNHSPFILILISLFLFNNKVHRNFNKLIDAYIFYPYYYLYEEINSFFYFRKRTEEKIKSFFYLKEKIPLYVLYPVYYSNFPCPELIILKGEGEKGDVVVSKGALVGKIIEKTGNILRVRTIFSPDFKCSLISKNKVLSLYQGTGDLKGEIYFYPSWAKIKKGDTLFTSGLTENFPKGIPAFVVDTFYKKKGDIFYTVYVTPLWRPSEYTFYFSVPPVPE